MNAGEALALPPSPARFIVFQPRDLQADLRETNVSIMVDPDLPPDTPLLVQLMPPEAFELTVAAPSQEVWLKSAPGHAGGSARFWVASERPNTPEELLLLDHDPEIVNRWNIQTTSADVRVEGYSDTALLIGELAVGTTGQGSILVKHGSFSELTLTQPDDPGRIIIGDDVSARFILRNYP